MKYILSAVIWAVILSGCVDESFVDNQDDVPEGMVRLSVSLNTPPGSAVTTRSAERASTEQDLTGNVVVMVFDSSDPKTAKLKQSPALGKVNSDATLTAQLKAETTKSHVCIAANVPDVIKENLLSLAAGAALVDIIVRLELAVPSDGVKSPLPMSGWSSEIAQITRNATTAISVSLVRSVGRIDVDGRPADFTVYGVQLVNGAPKGWVFPQEILPYFGETDVVAYPMMSLGTPEKLFTEQLYCFEKAGMRGNTSKPTRVVIKGQRREASSPSYYAIEIVYKEAGATPKDRYDIERNKIYTILLNKVDKDGYATYEEAAKSEAFNNLIESDIVVTDPYAYNIVTNGKQYMGITNSNFVLYPISEKENASNLLVATLSYTCDPGWSEGTITAPAGIELTTDRLEVQHGSASLYKDIIVKNITAGFSEGVIVAHIGNLRQEIKVTVKAPTMPTGQIIDDYFTAPDDVKDYKVGEIIAPTAETAWLKVSSSALDAGGSSLNDKITHPEGGIYIHVQPNIGFDASATPREASLFVSGSKETQRTRIYVQQNNFDVYSDKLQIKPFTYVGTFHRWNQTAERLIRIDASTSFPGGGNVWWQAAVVAGREFIVLSKENSLDRGIDCDNNPYGLKDDAHYKTDEAIEANCQVNSTLRTVSGNSTYIYFKVGLTGRLSGPTAAPRYGLIALTYGSGTTTHGTHNIYVRQGEAADYLMRPWDASTTPINQETGEIVTREFFASSTRPKAVKFGVYNLTNPDLSKTTPVIDLGARGYNFVQYPTQGGYYFLSSGTQAIKPTVDQHQGGNIKTLPTFDIDNPWKSDWETCPRGYRRPDDGKGRATNNQNIPIKYTDDIENSEVRQSLWLFPLRGTANSDFSNQIQGYLADGFFDRRHIETSDKVTLPNIEHIIVNKDSINASYWGFLVFNPHNYASIFAPLNGVYWEESTWVGGAGTQGQDGYFHTKTAGGGENDGWLVAFGYFTAGQAGYAFDSYQKSSARTGYAIRCIRDEQPAIGTGDSQVEQPTEGGSSMVINLSYKDTGASLGSLIDNKYTAEQLKKTNTVAINAMTPLTDDDYLYLNLWASKTDHQLHHLVIRGANTIPVGAFVSTRWYTISLIDANDIKTGAFTATLTGLKELSLPHLDKITVETGAFGFRTEDVQLFLNGVEYENRNGEEWKSYTWRRIKKY